MKDWYSLTKVTNYATVLGCFLIFAAYQIKIMQTWFSCKVKYQKIDEHGKQVRANETYLVEAINFTEAETRIFELMEEYGNADIMVSGISKTNFSEIVNYEDGQYWYKAKVTWEDYDEGSGKVSKAIHYFLVAANSVKECFDRVEENLHAMAVPFDIPSISLSPILDVFPLHNEEDEQEEIPSNLKPLSDFETAAHTGDSNEADKEISEEESELE